MAETLIFSYNWNGKLDTKTFTTIRKYDRFKEKRIYSVFLKDKYLFDVVCLKKKFLKLSEISDTRAYLDTGYNAATTCDILKKMYPYTNWDRQSLVWVLLKRIK